VIALLELTKNKVISLTGTESDDDIMISPAESVSQPAVSIA
ncbi:MAG: hypothetical protein H6Q28_806, partial [Bacteroidetes bacterium]|nr:hypothetical protein [Bacteroidota bacterium]